MQAQKVVKKTIILTFKIILYLCLFIVVGAISYKTTLYLSGSGKKNTSTNHSSTSEVVQAKPDAIAKNLILSVDEETAEVQSIVLEIFNTNTKNIDLVTIPATTKVEMSQELYSKLLEANEKVPQIITLSDIGQYFDQSVAYEYETLILNEFLNTNISFYSALLTNDFEQYFKKTSSGDGAYTFKSDVVSKWKSYTEAEQYLDDLMNYYEQVQSNLKLADRKPYTSYYLNANYAYIHTHIIKEQYEDGQYQLSDDNKNLVESIIENDSTYTSSKVTDTEVLTTSSDGVKIQILNSTGISGLAAKYEAKLKEDGYAVANIGNYTGEKQTTTRIIVKESSLGKHFESYFNSPMVEVNTIEGGYDILIIIGSMDA
ncbi:MAG: LytR C-terminal domain-containing protein [bacterium]|nr:LytR C-terminal domain-containing protein [bacterium]